MSKQQAWILIVVVVLGMSALVQMNRYRYFEQTLGQAASAHILRIDRLTGQQCVVSVPVAFRSAPESFLELVKMPGC